MYLKKLLIIFILLISNLHSKELEKVSLQLDWLHQFQFAGYYIAKEKGFYEDANLDVNIKEFNFNINLLDDVLNSKSEYAIGKSSLIIDALENKKLLLLSAIYQSSPMVLISLNKNIKKPIDLINKKIMLTDDARSAASINSMLTSQGVRLENINFIPHSFKLEDLINNKTDAMGCYLSNEPFLLKKKNIDFTIHNPSDYGFDFYGGLLFTSNKELTNNPYRVKKFQEASLQGWKYAFENIDETAKLIYKKYNTQNKSLEALIYEGEVLKKLAKFDEGLLGEIDFKKIEEIKRLYLLLGIAKNNENYKLDDLIYNPNKVYLSQKEKNYLEKNKITLLTNSNFPPFTMISNNTLSGIEIDYWNLINKKLDLIGANTKIINKNSIALSQLKNDKNSVKYAFSENDKKQYLENTNTIVKITIGVVTSIKEPFINNIIELNDRKVAITKYSSLHEKLKQKYPKINFIETKNLKEGLNLLSQKKVFAVIGKLPLLSYNITKNSLTNMKIAGTFEEKFDIRLLVNKENDTLINILNKTILSITNEEKERINKEYYPVIYQTSYDYSWLYKIVIPLIIIIFIIIIANIRLNKEIKKRKKIEEELNKVVNIDSLTNIYNRRKIESLYEREIVRIKRYKRELSIIFFDVDNFKQINDTLGHATGDEVLTKIAIIVKNNIRNSDFFGRWGGEEFFIVLPETNKEKALNVAHILKDKINSCDFNIEKNVTCSFGVSQFEETDSADSLLTRADNAMYYVKRNGKNNVKAV